ncbi:hypothetical protein KYB31_15745 [Clostridium felsineum]|uniref:hypothetical protein n=1 Tax=Clostridium felsineum TaxID=36839 RepID=UPI00214DC4F5|nr:hypothetical protein [Clostridium felsineum]MCR3760431.1 hypothetical protein [Clostridium felsineum]
MNNVTIGVICSLLGAVVSFFTITKYYQQGGQHDGNISTKIDYIQRGVDDIRIDIKAQDNKIEGIIERIAKVEESAKSAHHRLDNLEEKK